MSQEKVDRYKDEKVNRKKLQQFEKLKSLGVKFLIGLICLGIVGWVGFSIYQNQEAKALEEKLATQATINLDAIGNYLSDLK